VTEKSLLAWFLDSETFSAILPLTIDDWEFDETNDSDNNYDYNEGSLFFDFVPNLFPNFYFSEFYGDIKLINFWLLKNWDW
jgi:hypothetical protein